jgi:hypothetical protein
VHFLKYYSDQSVLKAFEDGFEIFWAWSFSMLRGFQRQIQQAHIGAKQKYLVM